MNDAEYYVDGVLAGDRRVLSKTLTLIESARTDHQDTAKQVIGQLLPHTGKATRIGITGVPGVGKSTFIETFGMYLVEKNHCLAVLAVDPSSQRSGGSVMADKTRMERLSVQKQAFIRPSPSGGTLGGVARKTRESMLVCEAAGFDVVVVETVGVGQSETTVASMVDFFLVLLLAGAGDQIQGIKKGVLEIADAIAINKADEDNILKARQAQKDYESALRLLTPSSPLWTPPVLTCSAREAVGIDDIWETVQTHRSRLSAAGELASKRKHQALEWMWAIVEQGLKDLLHQNAQIRKRLPQLITNVEKGVTAPTTAAVELLGCLDLSFEWKNRR